MHTMLLSYKTGAKSRNHLPMIDLVVAFVLLVFTLVLLCFCVATVSRRIKIYKNHEKRNLCSFSLTITDDNPMTRCCVVRTQNGCGRHYGT